MSLPLQKSPLFLADFERQYAWYAEKAGLDLADRYSSALNETLGFLAQHPAAGRRRRFRHPSLKALRSFRARPPFSRHLGFYRFDDSALYAERVMHGARDLPRRLREPLEKTATSTG